MVNSAAEDDTARSPALQLLADIRTVFDAKFMESDALCAKLRALSESPWEQIELNPSRLGARLREYSIKTGHTEDKSGRGCHLADFADAFARYLPPEQVSEGVHPVQGISDPDQKVDNMIEHRQSSHTANEVDERASTDHSSADQVPDTSDTVGRLLGEQATGPSPAAMPKRQQVGATATVELPKPQRARTRGGQSSRPRR